MSALGYEPATESAWRELVDKGLAGASFERALVATTAEGLAMEPLYLARHVEAIAGGAPAVRAREGAWRVGQRYTSALLAARTETKRLEQRQHLGNSAEGGEDT